MPKQGGPWCPWRQQIKTIQCKPRLHLELEKCTNTCCLLTTSYFPTAFVPDNTVGLHQQEERTQFGAKAGNVLQIDFTAGTESYGPTRKHKHGVKKRGLGR